MVAGLTRHGYDAYACAQEHSGVPLLWRHLEPDVVVFLDVDLASLRKRRGNPDWSEAIYKEQLRRLQSARESAHVVVDSAEMTAEEALARAIAEIERVPEIDYIRRNPPVSSDG
jgi:hypothetical protein